METIKIAKKHVKMIAHRGMSGILQENTVPAFLLAATHSYYGIETDLHVTKDGKYIICHDDNILRVSNIDMVIEESNFEDLRKVLLLNKDGSLSNDMYLPTLEEYIYICKQNNKKSILELKNKMDEKYIIEIVGKIKEMNHYEDTVFISFSSENIINLKKNFHDINCQFLIDINTKEKWKFAFSLAKKYGVDLDLYYGSLSSDYVKICKENNIKINVWTVDKESDAVNLIDMGVDYITSNILE
jgi:glycerophosphoryl diester phosphodiesterase